MPSDTGPNEVITIQKINRSSNSLDIAYILQIRALFAHPTTGSKLRALPPDRVSYVG